VTPNYIAIGHIAKDLLPGGGFAPGGTVTFAALAARNLGAKVAIVTAAPDSLRQLPLYQGIEVRGPETEVATIFENIYRPEGRIQFVRAVAPVIQTSDIPEEWCGPNQGVEIVHLAPIAQECGPGLIDLFPGAIIGATPQGFMRDWSNETGQVRAIEWEGAAELLPRIAALILSEEDLPAGQAGREMLDKFVRLCPIVACTEGIRGCTIYYKGRAEHVPAYQAREIDPTGAGDVFAAAFLIQLRASADPIAAARFANAAAACSIEQIGPNGVPSLEEVYKRMQ
jgi:sugar/nucleoside kinase (ribokinase family)